jgi:hypothetical protein
VLAAAAGSEPSSGRGWLVLRMAAAQQADLALRQRNECIGLLKRPWP